MLPKKVWPGARLCACMSQLLLAVWNLQYDVDVTKQQEEISQCLHAPAEEVKDEMAQKKV